MTPQTDAYILLIDEDDLIRDRIASDLIEIGFRVIQCADGLSGLAAVARGKPEVVLLDLRMPEMDGLDVLHQLKETDKELPVIVVTGAGVLKDAIEALRMGAFDFISKPIIDMAILEHSVRKALERTTLRRENRRYREHLEDEIKKRTRDLEQRTGELEQTNARLRDEMAGRRRTESALQQSQSQVADIISVFEGFIYTMDRAYNLQYMNPKLLAVSGREKTGGICHHGVYSLKAPCPLCPVARVLEDRTTVRSEFKSTKDGRWYYGIYSPQEDERGGITGCQAIVMDINERKMAEEALAQREALLREQNLRLRSSFKGTLRFGDIIGKSRPMNDVYRTILRAAESSANAFIYGESGTGKELVARTIHDLSERGDKPFVAVNCGAIPDNLIESEFFGFRK
ncbi:MAG: response regulator, partial [Desulfosarcinaceae bacterium]